MKLRYLWFLLFSGFSSSWSQTLLESQGLPWGDARTQALGGRALAAIDPENGVFLEPAALAQASSVLSSFSQERFSAQDFSFETASAFPLVPGTFAIGFGWDNGVSRNSPLVGYVRDNNGQFVVDPVTGQPQTIILGYFTQEQHNFFGSIAGKMGPLSLGASFKYRVWDLGGAEGTGWGWDAGLRLAPDEDIQLALALYDPGDAKVDFHGQSPDRVLPGIFQAAGRWVLARPGEVTLGVEPQIEGSWGGGQVLGGAGMEMVWRQDIALRMGYSGEHFTWGIGLTAHPEKVFKEIRVDYAYLPDANQGYPSRLTLGVTW